VIEPKYFTLNTLFADRVFRIPHYQRFYSWQKKQRDDLFRDIEDLFIKEREDDRHHFMATIVCFRTGEKKPVKSVDYGVFEIVDGQQRITTLVLLLKAIQQQIDDEEVQTEIGKILIKDDDNLLLLQTNNINQHLFNKYLRDSVTPGKDELKTHADRNFLNAVREINKFIAKWEKANRTLMDLLRLIRNRIGFVVYDTEDKYDVYTVFECLNSRGLTVDWLDKTKSALMGVAFEKSKSREVAVDQIKELNDQWANIYNEIAQYPVPGQEILRVSATIFIGKGIGRPLSAEESINSLRNYCTTAEKTIEVTGWLHAVTEKLVKMHKSRQWAPITNILQVRILAVSLMLTDSLNDNERETALEQWECVSFRIYGLFNKDSRTKVGDYVRLAVYVMQKAEGVENFNEIMKALRELGAEHPIKDAVDEFIREPKYYGFEEECRYILWRYEEYLADEQGAEINKELREDIWSARSPSETIEHIFPQNPSSYGPWKDLLLEDPSIKDNVDRIGNLLLLPPGLNSEAGRKGFAEKKNIYQKAEGLRIVSEVLVNRVWNLHKIKEREKKVVDFLTLAFEDVH